MMKKTVKKYISIGIVLGFIFPICAITFEYIRNSRLLNIRELHLANPLLFIIDTAPLFLGVVSYIAGVNQSKSEELITIVERNKDEIANALTNTERSHNALKVVFDKIKDTSPELVNHVGDLDNTIYEIISKLDEITVKTSASINNVSTSLDITKNKMQDSNKHIIDTEKHTKICEDLTSSYIDSMDNIVKTVDAMSETFKDLREYSSEFDSIIGFINKVSKETRLLSLNASVEASRAGNEGSGFSVIANKIRSMAEDIAEATLKISNQIIEMHRLIDTLDNNVNSIVSSVSSSSKLTEDTKVTIQGISNKINSLKLNMDEISCEIHEQFRYVQDISKDSESINITANDIKTQLNTTKQPLNKTMIIMKDIQGSISDLVS